jgi:OOP family OmpA-OmpF porin
MKYTLAFSALLAATLLGASDYDISIMSGYTIADGGQYFDNYGTTGAEVKYNGFESALKPELSFLYSDANYRFDSGSTKVFRSSLNGVYAFEKGNTVIPFFKIGAGYESLSTNAFGNRDGVFADAAMGLKFDITKTIAMKLEAIKMLKFNNNDLTNNLLLMGGISFAFGDNEPKAVADPEPKSVISSAVVAEKPAVAAVVTEKPAAVAAAPVAAPIIDSDNDGVIDQNDLCPNTPSGVKIDTNGCPLKATINDHFVFNSDHIDSTAASEIRAFVVFMKENPRYKATITGHTDSIGTPEHNQILSEKRAEKVKNALVEQGIASERLTTIGKGESMPIVSNLLKAGRAENRRIEVDIHE